MSGKWQKEKVNRLKINQLTSQKVRVKGLEPIRARHQILSLACLPISTHPLLGCKDSHSLIVFQNLVFE